MSYFVHTYAHTYSAYHAPSQSSGDGWIWFWVIAGAIAMYCWNRSINRRSEFQQRYRDIVLANMNDERWRALEKHVNEQAEWHSLSKYRPEIHQGLLAFQRRDADRKRAEQEVAARKAEADRIAREKAEQRQRESVMTAQATAWKQHGIRVGTDGTHVIYMLFRGDTVVYVGRTDSMYNRLQQHLEQKAGKFDTVRQFIVPTRHAGAVEGALIRHIRPVLNQKNESPQTAHSDHRYIEAFNTNNWLIVDRI